jgi:hypothetical protein
MGVGEQLDLPGVEPNALPTTARILHARVKVRIVKGKTSGVAPLMVNGARRSTSSEPGSNRSQTSGPVIRIFRANLSRHSHRFMQIREFCAVVTN